MAGFHSGDGYTEVAGAAAIVNVKGDFAAKCDQAGNAFFGVGNKADALFSDVRKAQGAGSGGEGGPPSMALIALMVS